MGLIRSGDEKDGATAAGESRAAELRSNVERLLEARVGPGRAVVEVSVDVETARESIVEKSFDPKGRVPISSETQEKSSNSTEPSPDVTVASNLPEGDAKGGTGGKSSTSETREMVNFEVSQTQRELMRQPVPSGGSRLPFWSMGSRRLRTMAPWAGNRAPRRSLPSCANWSAQRWGSMNRVATG